MNTQDTNLSAQGECGSHHNKWPRNWYQHLRPLSHHTKGNVLMAPLTIAILNISGKIPLLSIWLIITHGEGVFLHYTIMLDKKLIMQNHLDTSYYWSQRMEEQNYQENEYFNKPLSDDEVEKVVIWLKPNKAMEFDQMKSWKNALHNKYFICIFQQMFCTQQNPNYMAKSCHYTHFSVE